MINEEHDIERLEKYLRNELGEEERLAIEGRLQQEPELRQLLNEVTLLTAGVRESARLTLKKDLAQIESTLPKVSGKAVRWRTAWALGMAASILLIVAVYMWWPEPTNSEELFAQYFEPYPNVIMPTVRGDLEPDTTLMAKAYRAYDQGQYDEAITYFEQVTEKDEGVYLYLGNSYLTTNKAEKAIACFEKVLNDYDVFDEQAEWYLVLSYIKANELPLAKNLSDRISKSAGSYSHKALLISSNLN